MSAETPAGQADPERITLNLTPSGAAALADLLRLSGDPNKTDAVIRALKLAAHVQRVVADGGRVYTRDAAGELERIYFL